MATGIFFDTLEDLEQQADEFSLEGKDRTKFLKEKWLKIQDAKLEKERFERKQSKHDQKWKKSNWKKKKKNGRNTI